MNKEKVLNEMENIDFAALVGQIQDAVHFHELKPEENLKDLLMEVMAQVLDDVENQ
jgi:hypothetical protein